MNIFARAFTNQIAITAERSILIWVSYPKDPGRTTQLSAVLPVVPVGEPGVNPREHQEHQCRQGSEEPPESDHVFLQGRRGERTWKFSSYMHSTIRSNTAL